MGVGGVVLISKTTDRMGIAPLSHVRGASFHRRLHRNPEEADVRLTAFIHLTVKMTTNKNDEL